MREERAKAQTDKSRASVEQGRDPMVEEKTRGFGLGSRWESKKQTLWEFIHLSEVIAGLLFVALVTTLSLSWLLQEYAQARFDAYFQQKKIWAV